MLTTLNIDIDIQPITTTHEEVDYEAEMLKRKVKKLTVDELKARIDESMKDIAEGRVYSEEEAWKIMDAI